MIRLQALQLHHQKNRWLILMAAMIKMIIINSMIARQCWSYVCGKANMVGNSLECTSCNGDQPRIKKFHCIVCQDTFSMRLKRHLDFECIQKIWNVVICTFDSHCNFFKILGYIFLARKYSANTIPSRAVTLHLDTRASKRNLSGETIVEKPRALAPLTPALDLAS